MNSRPRSASTLSRAPPSEDRSSPQKRTPSAQRARDSPSCPLADPDLGLVPMTDHQNRRCLCRFCTCGTHKCPGEVPPNPYPKAMFTSQYQSHHAQKTPIKVLLPVRKEHRENVNPIETLTQCELAYRPYRVLVTDRTFDATERTAKQRPQSAGPRPRFAATSTYQLDFPSWGATHPDYVKRYYEPVPTKDLPFDSVSEYLNRFKQNDLKASAVQAVSANAHSSLTLHGKAIKMQANTTGKSEFQPWHGVHRQQSCKRDQRILDLAPHTGMYATEYAKQFIKQTPILKNPQDVKRYLSAREE